MDGKNVEEQVRSPIYFDPSVNNRAPPSEWKPAELSSDVNNTDNSWPPVWYLERTAHNNKITSAPGKETGKTTDSPIQSASTVANLLVVLPSHPTTIKPIKTTTNLMTNSTELVPEKPRTRITTAVLARMCLFQNVCSNEEAEEYFRNFSTTTSPSTIRTSTNAPLKTTRRPRKRNRLLIAQVRACMQDKQYCNTNVFNKARISAGGVSTERTSTEEVIFQR